MDKICVMLIKLCMEGNTFACIKGGNSYTKMDKTYLESIRKYVKDLFIEYTVTILLDNKH